VRKVLILLVPRSPFKARVLGSNPSRLTTINQSLTRLPSLENLQKPLLVLMKWPQPSSQMSLRRGNMGVVRAHNPHPSAGRREGAVMHTTTLGIDLAKNVFQLHGVDARGRQCSADA